jgi:hypothetical protein
MIPGNVANLTNGTSVSPKVSGQGRPMSKATRAALELVQVGHSADTMSRVPGHGITGPPRSGLLEGSCLPKATTSVLVGSVIPAVAAAPVDCTAAGVAAGGVCKAWVRSRILIQLFEKG